MWTAEMLKDMLVGLEASGMDLSIMEIRVKNKAGVVDALSGTVDIIINDDGTYGRFTFEYGE